VYVFDQHDVYVFDQHDVLKSLIYNLHLMDVHTQQSDSLRAFHSKTYRTFSLLPMRAVCVVAIHTGMQNQTCTFSHIAGWYSALVIGPMFVLEDAL
jgi:hypothetical protein